jgi:hypothetical protein
MYHSMDGWGSLWMSFITGFWVGVVCVAVYLAVRLGQRPPGGKRS